MRSARVWGKAGGAREKKEERAKGWGMLWVWIRLGEGECVAEYE